MCVCMMSVGVSAWSSGERLHAGVCGVVCDRTMRCDMMCDDVRCSTMTLVSCLVDRSQVHTVGTDIYNPPDVVAAVSISKDSTLRDYAQGCWRMRDLGSGHAVHLIVRATRRRMRVSCAAVSTRVWCRLYCSWCTRC
jgi:hypothetical protein